MDYIRVTVLFACFALVTAIYPIEKFHAPKPYSFGYAIKDKHGEQHRQEIGDVFHNVKGSYGFKDERGIERHVNYIADKAGFRAEVKTNEPGTAPLNPAAVKMESSAHPYYGMSKGPIAVAAGKNLVFVNELGFPGMFKMDAAELAKAGFAFDAALAKENKLEKAVLGAELMKGGLPFGAGFGLEKLAKEELAFAPENGLVKETEAAKGLATGFGLDPFFKNGFALVPFEEAVKESAIEKEGLAQEKSLGAEEFAKLGHLYSPLLAKENFAFELQKEELKKRFGLEKLTEAYPYVPKLTNEVFPFAEPLPYAGLKPKGFIYGGPIKGGIVKGYDARFY